MPVTDWHEVFLPNDGEATSVGALVARDDRGVLLAGDSGTGKSTAALCCLEAGWTYLGHDWVGIGRAADGGIIGHSLYSSVALEPAQVARIDELLQAPRP